MEFYTHNSPRNPLRTVDWRWARAGQIVDSGLPYNSRRDDVWVKKAVKFRTACKAATTELDYARIADDQPDLYYAWRISQAADKDQREAMFRYGVEARLLADSGDGEIAERTGLHKDDVVAYEKLFFNVRERLDNRDFIISMVLGPAVHRGLNCRDYDLLWKLYGYMRGPAVVDALTTTFLGGRSKVAADDVRTEIEKDQNFDVVRNAAFAGKSMRILVETQADIVGLYFKLKDLERTGGGVSSSQDALMAQVGAFLHSATYRIGPPRAGDDRSMIDALPYEPTSAELIQAGMGQSIEVDSELIDLEYPTPASR